MIFQVTELMNSQARTQTHRSGLFTIITQSWPCPAHTACPKGLGGEVLMLTWMSGSGTYGAVSRLWAKRGFSPSLSPGAWEPADAAGGRGLW